MATAPHAGMEVGGPSPRTIISPHVAGWPGNGKSPQVPGMGHFFTKAYYFEKDKAKLINVHKKAKQYKAMGTQKVRHRHSSRGAAGPSDLAAFFAPTQAHFLVPLSGLLVEEEFASIVGVYRPPGLRG